MVRQGKYPHSADKVGMTVSPLLHKIGTMHDKAAMPYLQLQMDSKQSQYDVVESGLFFNAFN